MSIGYWGGRAQLFASICASKVAPSHSLQIVDLTVPAEPLTGTPSPPWWDMRTATVILSVRRFHTNDELGARETTLLECARPCLVLRCCPLEINIPLYYQWACRSGILGSSFDPSGVAWLPLADLLATCEQLSSHPEVLLERHGRAYDATGPRKVPMVELAEAFARASGQSVTNRYIDPSVTLESLVQSGMSRDFAAWTVHHQVAVSDPRLPDVSPTLRTLLGRDLHDPLASWSAEPS